MRGQGGKSNIPDHIIRKKQQRSKMSKKIGNGKRKENHRGQEHQSGFLDVPIPRHEPARQVQIAQLLLLGGCILNFLSKLSNFLNPGKYLGLVRKGGEGASMELLEISSRDAERSMSRSQ